MLENREMLVELYDVARLMRTRFDRWARTYGMTRAQGVILARLSRQPGMTQNEMAGLCEVEPITVGRLVDRLEARGLIRAPPRSRRPPHPPPASAAGRRAHPERDPALQGRAVPRNHRRPGRSHGGACDRCASENEDPTDHGAAREDRGGGRIECHRCQRHGFGLCRAAPKLGRRRDIWADKARLRRVLMIWGVGVFLPSPAPSISTGGRYISADDSYVHANKLMVSTDVSGLVQSVSMSMKASR